MVELLKVGSSYNRPVKQFAISSESDLDDLPLNVPMCSRAWLLDGENGLREFMLRKTDGTPDNGEWVEVTTTIPSPVGEMY